MGWRGEGWRWRIELGSWDAGCWVLGFGTGSEGGLGGTGLLVGATGSNGGGEGWLDSAIGLWHSEPPLGSTPTQPIDDSQGTYFDRPHLVARRRWSSFARIGPKTATFEQSEQAGHSRLASICTWEAARESSLKPRPRDCEGWGNSFSEGVSGDSESTAVCCAWPAGISPVR